MSYAVDQLEIITSNVYEIEDTNGNTLCKFQLDAEGEPINMIDCSHADTDETVRIQLEDKSEILTDEQPLDETSQRVKDEVDHLLGKNY